MILPKSNRLTPEQLAQITEIVAEFGCKIQPIVGAVRTIYAIVGDEREELMINRLEGLAYVDRIDRIQSPFKLMDKRSDLASHRIRIGGVTLGEELFVIAGACTIDPKNPNYFYETAAAVKEAGANALRGGVWKPRTNPYTFQGDVKSLDILMEASRRTGLPVDTEVMEEAHIKLALDAGVHTLQVGARNALNYSLLRAIGRAIAERDAAVLLKRSIHMGPLSEFISAAEYIAAFGNPNVILCPRGTTPTLDGYRTHAAVEGENVGARRGRSVALGGQGDLRARVRARGGRVWRGRTLHRGARRAGEGHRRRSEAGAAAARAQGNDRAGEAALGDSAGRVGTFLRNVRGRLGEPPLPATTRSLQQTQLRIVGRRDGDFFLWLRLRRGGGEGDAGVVALEFREDGLRAVDHAQREAGKAGDLDAVAAVGGAGNYAANEDDLVVPLLDGDGEVAEAQQVF